jgi:hypothetical protein
MPAVVREPMMMRAKATSNGAAVSTTNGGAEPEPGCRGTSSVKSSMLGMTSDGDSAAQMEAARKVMTGRALPEDARPDEAGRMAKAACCT